MLQELRIGENGEYIYDREKVAIERLRHFECIALQFSDKGYYLADSGGKDSTVIKKLAEMSGVKFEIVHNHTTLDHPETVYFVRREKKRYESMGISYTISMPEMSFWKLMRKKKMPPLRQKRYCCKYLKERGGKGRTVITGVRWAESVKRKKRGIAEIIKSNYKDNLILLNDNEELRKELETCLVKGKRIVNPIIDWSDDDVWEFIHKYNLPYNPLYDMGYKRVGCVGCPMSTKGAEELESLPKYKAQYIRTFDKLVADREEKGLKCNFETGLDWYKWWISNAGKPDENQQSIDFEEDDEDE